MLQVNVTTPGEMPRPYDADVDPSWVLDALKGQEPETCVFLGRADYHIVYKVFEDGNDGVGVFG